MDWRLFRDKYSIVMHHEFIDDDDLAESDPIEDVATGEVVAYYLQDGYDVITAYHRPFKSYVPKGIIFRMSYCLAWLNPDMDFDVLSEFVVLYSGYLSNLKHYVVDKKEVRGILDYAMDKVDVDQLKTKRRFYWTNRTGFLSLEQKRRVINSYTGKTRAMETIKKVENTLEWMFIEGNEFITVKSVAEKLGMTANGLSVYLEPFRGDIDKHNIRLFNTDNFNTYRKILSVHKINDAIDVLNNLGERISRRKVADKADLHFNTVGKLWEDPKVQEQLEKYNQISIKS